MTGHMIGRCSECGRFDNHGFRVPIQLARPTFAELTMEKDAPLKPVELKTRIVCRECVSVRSDFNPSHVVIVSEEDKQLRHKCHGDERLIAAEMLRQMAERMEKRLRGEE